MKCHYLKQSALIIGACLLSAAGLADPTITFKGEVTDQTCKVAINGTQGNAVVTLPTVTMSDFGVPLANAQIAGLTTFTVALSECAAPRTSAQHFKIAFTGQDVDSGSGVMKNTATANRAEGFGIQLIADGTGATPVPLVGKTSVPGPVLGVDATGTSYDYAAQYYVIDATMATPGLVEAVAEYTLEYP